MSKFSIVFEDDDSAPQGVTMRVVVDMSDVTISAETPPALLAGGCLFNYAWTMPDLNKTFTTIPPKGITKAKIQEVQEAARSAIASGMTFEEAREYVASLLE